MKERFCCGQALKSNKKIVPSVSAPLHLILRAPSPASHEWKTVPKVKRLCQVCHLVVDGNGVRCRSCGLRAHSACGSNYYNSSLNTTRTGTTTATRTDNNRNLRTSGNIIKGDDTTIGTGFGSQQDNRQGSLFYRHFEPRIKKILHPQNLSLIESSGGEERGSGASSSARFSSSCGDSVAASTAIVVGTVSIETTRSESKTPEITITPGSDEDEDEQDSTSRPQEETILPENHLAKSKNLISGPAEQGSSSSGQGNRTFVIKKKRLLHVDGPIDGSPYAVITPLVKQKPFPDSGFSLGVNQMKDLDQLISALVEEADSIDAPNHRHNHHHNETTSNIPYHARQDSLPFSYTSPQSITLQSEKIYNQSQQQRSYSTSTPTAAVDSGRHINHYSVSSPSPLYATPTPSSRNDYYSSASRGGRYESDIHAPQPLASVPMSTGLSRSISHQPSYPNYGRSQPSSSQMVASMSSSNSFNYGGGGGTGNGNGVRRNRSQSADGRRDFERGGDENADEWLARQQRKLREKKASKHVVRNDWLAELKRALPQNTQQVERSQSQTDYSRSSQQATPIPIIQEFRPSQLSSSSRVEASSHQQQASSSTFSTPSGPGRGRGQVVAYSSDDDDDVELDIFQRGKKVQRHYSESTYDRTGGYNTSSSSRAPSQQSNVEGPFPTCPPTPYSNRPISPPGKPPRSPKAIRRYQGGSSAPISPISVDMMPSSSSRMERAQTPVNPRPIFMVDSEVKFAQDLSEYWYKPIAAREETVSALIQSPIGSFCVRNSNSFPGAYGLAVKADNTGEKGIRHFLIEPTRFGCRLRGCGTLEPVFGSLSALVYAHSIECLALPTTLTLPSYDILPSSQSQSKTAHLLRQGAACQLLFLGMVGVECLSGEEAISKGVSEITASSPVPISLRLSRSGLTLTDVFRQRFFRIHFALNEILYASVVAGRSVAYGREVKQVFGIVARAPRAMENSVILLAEFEPGQPANAIVSFIQRVLAWQQH
ncbi:tensin homolog isoform X4 [Folsomia candida]|uniref:tensin homolog isoform X4 n=1 Tax=Folsomia candida TaxID=158441 RepID=UPI000B8FCF92|nr:tensin homolog isoform X4 [Folsomia candida]